MKSFLLVSDEQACLAAMTIRINPYIGWCKSWAQVANMSAAQERRGYGRLLFRAVEDLLLREGVDVLALYPAPNGKAPMFWSAMGFHEADGSFLPPEELLPFNRGGPLWPEVTGNKPLARFEKRIATTEAVRRSPSELRFGELIGQIRPHVWLEDMWRPNGCVNMATVRLDELPPPISSSAPPKPTPPQPKVKAERKPKPLPPRRQQPPRACKPVREVAVPPRRAAPALENEAKKQRLASAPVPAPPAKGPRARADARAAPLPQTIQTTPVQRTRTPRAQLSPGVTPSLPKRRAEVLTPEPVRPTSVAPVAPVLLAGQSLLKRRRVELQ
ncbi:unnamed protein product [Effrenium voratum]|nr:unnamed protein product [Effrenium voratum]